MVALPICRPRERVCGELAVFAGTMGIGRVESASPFGVESLATWGFDRSPLL